jgi:hypothetical protein
MAARKTRMRRRIREYFGEVIRPMRDSCGINVLCNCRN